MQLEWLNEVSAQAERLVTHYGVDWQTAQIGAWAVALFVGAEVMKRVSRGTVSMVRDGARTSALGRKVHGRLIKPDVSLLDSGSGDGSGAKKYRLNYGNDISVVLSNNRRIAQCNIDGHAVDHLLTKRDRRNIVKVAAAQAAKWQAEQEAKTQAERSRRQSEERRREQAAVESFLRK